VACVLANLWHVPTNAASPPRRLVTNGVLLGVVCRFDLLVPIVLATP
jgi:hypothetical protein